MNPSQMAQQIKHLLQQVRWPVDPADLVFGARGSVAVFAGRPAPEQIPPGFPWCMVGIDAGQFDPDEPGLITQAFSLIVATEVAGDRLGEHAIIGGAAASLGKSAGRGIGEVAERARWAVANLTGMDGARIIVSASRTAAPEPMDRGRHLVIASLDVEALCTSAPHYVAPQLLNYETNKWTWAGDHCAARFDFVRYRLVRKTGTDPSIDPEDGTVIYTGTTPEFVGARVNGQVYTVFADYNSRGSGGGGATVEGSSYPEIGSFRPA